MIVWKEKKSKYFLPLFSLCTHAQEDHIAKFPMILFGSVSLVPCLLVFLLPEMKGRRQPQTITDLEQIFEECKHSKKQRLRNTDEAWYTVSDQKEITSMEQQKY